MRAEVRLNGLVKERSSRQSLAAKAQVVAAAVVVALSLAVWGSECMGGSARSVRVVWKMDLPFGIDVPLGSSLEDVGPHGAMLLRSGRYMLLVWRPGATAPAAKLSLSAWPENSLENFRTAGCKFAPDESRIVCVHGPWLVLLDVGAGKVIRRIAGTKVSSGLDWESAEVQMSGKVPFEMPSSPVVFAVDPKGGRVAVAYNRLGNPNVQVFSGDLRTRVASWKTQKHVESLFWSPDGQRLGVLNFVDRDQASRVPNVSVFDAGTGKKLLSFATGDLEARASFSPDEQLIYVIARSGMGVGSPWGWAGETLRAFSSTTGKLVRTFKVSGTGVRNNFAVSQDGRFIAAESSKPAHSDLHYLLRLKENLGGELDAGFVILDANTGHVIFRKTWKIFGEGRFADLRIRTASRSTRCLLRLELVYSGLL